MSKAIPVLVSLLLLIVGFSYAGTYYVWGPEELEPTWSVLNAIVQLIDSSVYKSALLVFLSLGLILLALGQLGSPRLGIVGWFVLVVLGIHVFLYGFRTTTQIHDITCDGWRTPIDCDRTVANVPSLLDDILQLMGAINKLAEHVGVTYGSISGGFPSKARCTEALTSLTLNHLRDSDTRESFMRYVNSCVVPCSYIDRDLWKRIADSEDLLNALTMPASCSFLEVYDPSVGTNISCVNFYTTKIYPNFSGSLDLTLDSDWYDKVITRYCSTALSAGLAYGGKNNLPPDDIARQAILTEGLLVALQQAGGGVEENLKTRMILTNQKLTTRSVLKAMSDWLREVFPMLKAVSQVFLIAFFPFALMFALLPISMRGLSLYFLSLIGVAFWSPAMAIANAVVNWFGEWQTSVLMYSPALIYELKEKLWLTGAIGAIAYAIIPVVLGLFTGGMVAGVWRAVFGAGSPVHLPETAKHQASDPLGAQRASAELAQRTSYEQRSELVSAGMFSGMMEAQKGISTAQTSTAHGIGGATAGGILGTREGIGISWGHQALSATSRFLSAHGVDLRKSGYSFTEMGPDKVAVTDGKTGEVVATINTTTGMVEMAKPDLTLSALLTRNLQRATSTIRDQSLSDAYRIAYEKTFGHDKNWGIDKVAQDLEAFSHTKEGANYRSFVHNIAEKADASEQDVHKAVSILQAVAGPSGTLNVGKARGAMAMALQRGGRMGRVMSAVLNALGFKVSGNLKGIGSSEGGHTSSFTVTSTEGDSYSADWRTSDTWRTLTQSTALASRKYGEGWSERDKESFDKNMALVSALMDRESIAETLGVGTGIDLSADVNRWAVNKYGYGGLIDMLRFPSGRDRLLKEYLQDRLGNKMSLFQGTVAKENYLNSLYPDLDIYGAWKNFRETGNTDHLKGLGLTEAQAEDIRKMVQSGNVREAYSAMIDYLLSNKGVDIASLVQEKTPHGISTPPSGFDAVENMHVAGVGPEDINRHIQATEGTINHGKAGIGSPSPGNARRDPSISEAVGNMPGLAQVSGALMGLASLAHGLSTFRGGGGGRANVLDDIFSKEEQARLRELRARAIDGDVRASQEYLDMWKNKIAELERSDLAKFKQVQEALKNVDMNRVLELEREVAERGWSRRAFDAFKGFINDLGKGVGAGVIITELLADSSPAHAGEVIQDYRGYVYRANDLAYLGLDINNQGHFVFRDNLTKEQIARLSQYGVDPQDIQTRFLPPDVENKVRSELALYKPDQPPLVK